MSFLLTLLIDIRINMKTLTEEEKEIATHLKASIWYTVSKAVERQTKKLSDDSGSTITATPQFIAALVELVYRQLNNVGEDLSLFANHARRKTITPEDMFMVVRKNEALREILGEYLAGLDEGAGEGKQGENGEGRKGENGEDGEDGENNHLKNPVHIKREPSQYQPDPHPQQVPRPPKIPIHHSQQESEDTFSDEGDYI
ncbi:DEKNAAC103021 [Brettanomyces naardenensis]|uniref:DEKNAAC103022 n=1 Tax=Brettanomyces naardenensis TaxID=13370 RepID=A0A448YM61_BRENA|nr:DEKNAAC103021 [Brettanomyces naardenensis]